VLTSDHAELLGVLGLQAHTMTELKNAPLHNASWLVELTDGRPVVLRRYDARATAASVAYEHAVLRYLADAGWVVPEPVGDLVEHQGRWYCPTRYVPGWAIGPESAAQQRRRGADLARLHIALRGLSERLGQRPGWQAQHMGVTVDAEFGWDACVEGLMQVSPRLGSWLSAAASNAQDALAALGAGELPVLVIHGDFAEWNVHYRGGRLAGVIDFALTHVDSRPYELAIARTYRSPQMLAGYLAELSSSGWPLSELEEAALGPLNCCFRVGMAAWAVQDSLGTGSYDLPMIERQLSRTGTSRP
jgi:Ser/Thr protein kinase RdoA (MazF antagonist)